MEECLKILQVAKSGHCNEQREAKVENALNIQQSKQGKEERVKKKKRKKDVLVCSGCYSKKSQTGWLTNNRNLFLRVPDNGKSKLMVLAGSVSGETLRILTTLRTAAHIMCVKQKKNAPQTQLRIAGNHQAPGHKNTIYQGQ